MTEATTTEAASLVDRARIFVNGVHRGAMDPDGFAVTEPVVVVTGSTIRATDAGDIILSPPRTRMELAANGRMAPVEVGPGRLFRKDGTVDVFPTTAGEA